MVPVSIVRGIVILLLHASLHMMQAGTTVPLSQRLQWQWNATVSDIRRIVPEFSCVLPNMQPLVYSTSMRNMSWIMLGADEFTSFMIKNRAGWQNDVPGIGNYLIFWPAIYWFAAFTGRSVVIGENIMGEFCHHVGCAAGGFPSKSDVMAQGLYHNDTPLEKVSRFDLQSHFEENARLRNLTNLRGSTVTPASEWWVWFAYLARCVSRLSRCLPGDVSCSERFALQRLVRGPFRDFPEEDRHRLHGMPTTLLDRILTVPHADFTPPHRISAAFHIRREFPHFEFAQTWNNVDHMRSVYEWSNSTEADLVYSEFVSRLLRDMPLYLALKADSSSPPLPATPVLVYISGDNHHVKRTLADRIAHATANSSHPVQVMFLDSPLTRHSKSPHAEADNGTGTASHKSTLLDSSFDWYCLTLASFIYGWRNKFNRGSTFVGSAGRTSGTLERTNMTARPSGEGGAYTKKFQLEKKHWPRGAALFTQEWGYALHEMYENKTLADAD